MNSKDSIEVLRKTIYLHPSKELRSACIEAIDALNKQDIKLARYSSTKHSYLCPECSKRVNFKMHFCPGCGQAIETIHTE